MNKLSKSARRTARSGVVAMLLLGIASPACTSSHVLGPAAAGNTPVHAETSSVRQQNDLAPVSPLVSLDESHKSFLVEPDAEPTEACTSALYIEEPMASGYVPVSVHEIEAECNARQVACFRRCYNRAPPKGKGWKKGDGDHYKYCQSMCLAQFMECRRRLGIVTRVFDAFDSAWAWIKDHKVAILGTIIVIGGVAYIVSTGGSGALVLIPLAG